MHAFHVAGRRMPWPGGRAGALAITVALAACGGGNTPNADDPDAGVRFRTQGIASQEQLAADASETLFTEGGKLMRADENVGTLGNDLFGDRVNLYNGTLEFVQTDVSLPGNSGLPVSAGRRRNTGLSYVPQGQFGDWDLEIPHLHGVFAQGTGWTVGPGVPTASTRRCTDFGPPPQVKGQNQSGIYNPVEYWHGHFLYVPGAGSQELLLPSTSPKAVNPTGPLAAPAARLTTKDRWQIYCGVALQNGAAGSEGFMAVAPDGARYRFDWMATRSYPEITKAWDAPPQLAQAGTGPSLANPLSVLKRTEVWIMPTEIEDRFGNKITYTYNPQSPWQLKSIVASQEQSGAVRRVDFGYASSLGSIITSITDGARTWRYGYAYLSEPNRPQGVVLNAVTLPDSSAWLINVHPIGSPGALRSSGGSGVCDGESLMDGIGAMGDIVHPSGARGWFRMGPTSHGRSHVERVCMGNDVDGTGWSYYPLYTPAYSLEQKTITGPGLPAAAPGTEQPGGYTWRYAYGPPNASFAGCPNCASTKTVEVTDPLGSTTRYTFGNRFRVNEGQLLRTESGLGANGPLRVVEREYTGVGDGPHPFPDEIGFSVQLRTAGDLSTRHVPERRRTTTQQATTFTWQADRYDALARAVDITRSSSLGHTRRERTVYADLAAVDERRFTDRWVLGQVKSVYRLDDNNTPAEEVESHDFDSRTLNRSASRSFQREVGRFTYHGDGNLWTRTDGRGNSTRLEDYKLGIARNVFYADGASERAELNDIGLITSVRNAAGSTTAYRYDAAGRLDLITPPADADMAYHPTELRFERVDADELGLPAGHWRQTVTTGAAKTERYFDALWRPVLTRSTDNGSSVDVSHAVLKRFDAHNRTIFESYARRSSEIPDIAGAAALSLKGTWRSFDELGRSLAVVQDSELGPLTTVTRYNDGFTRTVTNPRGHATTTGFQAFDAPSENAAKFIQMPLGVNVVISRDVFGKPTAIARGDGAVSTTRYYFYDEFKRLCKTVEPETGATLQDYDGADNVIWRASGLANTGPDCDRAAVPEARKVKHDYDPRNRLRLTSYGDNSPAVQRTYTPDGLLETTTTLGSTWTYQYNNRRLLTLERFDFVGQIFDFPRVVNAYGHLQRQDYYTGLQVDYAPNALGQPTKAGGFAHTVRWHPNGGLAEYTLVTGIRHVTTQNMRGLPEHWRDEGVADDAYTYDANGNVLSITDRQQAGAFSRSMGYDALDRLTQANSPAGAWGAGSYTYDALDNLRTTTLGGRTRVNRYDDPATQRLTSTVVDGVPIALRYDPNGNVVQRGSQEFTFDIGNRLATAANKASYVYDGHGRRTWSANIDGSNLMQAYSRDGKLLFSAHSTKGSEAYIYLGGKLIAEPHSVLGTRFVHTDALGSPVARTDANGRLVSRTRYEPYGAEVGGLVPSGVGFTGHFGDGDTGLVYMQQRYYDPVAGRFLSVDPVTTDANTGSSFARYQYANDNPYLYVDPTGMAGRYPEGSVMWKILEKEDAVCATNSCEGVSGLSRANTVKAGAVLGGTLGGGVALACAGASGGVCGAGSITIIGAGIAGGAAAASAAYDVFEWLSNLIQNSNNAQATESEAKPNLLDPEGEKHVLDGDANGGGHRSGTGRPGKSEFPGDWSDQKVAGEISDIATDPRTRWSKPDSRGYISGTGRREGVDIKVVFDTKKGRIVTGYPTNRPRNP